MNKDIPPVFIFGTSDDKYGNSSLVFTQALRDNHTDIELHFLQNGGHGYGLRPDNVAARTWPWLAEVWLDKTIKSINKKEKIRNLTK